MVNNLKYAWGEGDDICEDDLKYFPEIEKVYKDYKHAEKILGLLINDLECPEIPEW